MTVSKSGISVVITAYNAERYISRSIDSVIKQEGEHCEIIVVNDASTDDTAEVIKGYGNRIKYIEFKENRGPAAGRTSGLFETDTEFVAFLDADDYWKEDFAGVMKEFMCSKPEVIAANCGYIAKGYDGSINHRPNLAGQDQIYFEGGNVCKNFFEFWDTYDCVRTGSVLMRTETAKKTEGQRADLRLTEDLEFWGYLATFGEWGFMPQPLFVTDEQLQRPWERLKKFEKRFSFFKDLEIDSWSRRILSNLKDAKSIAYFNSYLTSIYTTIAFAKAYSFDFSDSYCYVNKNFHQISQKGWGKVLRIGSKTGPVGWPVVCLSLRFREILKAYSIFLFKSKEHSNK